MAMRCSGMQVQMDKLLGKHAIMMCGVEIQPADTSSQSHASSTPSASAKESAKEEDRHAALDSY